MKIGNWKLKNNAGLYLIEVLISISILAALSLVGVWYFSSATKAEVLKKEKQGLSALLSEARSLAISSKEASRYGVHIEEFQAVLFKGSTYSSTDPNNVSMAFHSAVHVLSHSFTYGGDEIIFSRLTGGALNFGTIKLSLITNALASTTITIRDTGVIE